MPTTHKSPIRTSFLLAAAALSLIQVEAADITVSSGTSSIGSGGSATTAADIVTVNAGTLEVTSNTTIGGLAGSGGQVSAGFQSSSYGDVTLTINVAEGANYVYNGKILPNSWDTQSVNGLFISKTGLGTQELAGSLIGYTSSTGKKPTINVSGGVLKMSGSWGFDTYVDYNNAITVNNGGTLQIARNWQYASGSAFNLLSYNANTMTVSGGTLRFSEVNQNAGRSFTVGGGGATLSVDETVNFNSTGTIAGSTAGNLTLEGASINATLTNAVGGTGTWSASSKLIKNGSGTWTVAGVAAGMAGGVEVSQGKLVLTANSASTGPIVISNGGTLELRSTLGLGMYSGGITNNGSLVYNHTGGHFFSGAISGNGTLEIKNTGTGTGTGVLSLNAANTFTGDTILTAGRLRLNHADAIKFSKLVTNSSSGTVSFGIAGGTYNVGALSGNGTIALSDTAATPGAITLVTGNSNVAESFTGILSGLGNLKKSGTNTLTLTGANTYAGQTIVSSGTLALSGAGTLGVGTVNLTGGALDLGALTVAFTNSVNINGGVLTGGSMDVAQVASAESGTVSTALTGTGGLTKTSAGLLVLGAGVTHTYSGPTLVNEGKLKVDGTIASSITVANGASLGGHGVINGNVSMSAGSTIAAGGSVGNLTVGSLTITSGTQVVWEVYDANGVAGVDYDKITVNGALDLSGLSGTNRATLVLSSLSDPLANLPGNAGLFDASLNHTFTLFTYGSLNLGSNTDVTSLFSIDKSLVRDGAGVLVDGVFSLSDTGSAINLVYTSAVPEPSTYGLALGFLSLAVVAIRRQRRKPSAQA